MSGWASPFFIRKSRSLREVWIAHLNCKIEVSIQQIYKEPFVKFFPESSSWIVIARLNLNQLNIAYIEDESSISLALWRDPHWNTSINYRGWPTLTNSYFWKDTSVWPMSEKSCTKFGRFYTGGCRHGKLVGLSLVLSLEIDKPIEKWSSVIFYFLLSKTGVIISRVLANIVHWDTITQWKTCLFFFQQINVTRWFEI